MIGQIGDRLVVMVDDLAEVDSRTLLVLAELSVGGLQIGKIDAEKRLVFLLVIACGSSISIVRSQLAYGLAVVSRRVKCFLTSRRR